jgi:hypothetical protein
MSRGGTGTCSRSARHAAAPCLGIDFGGDAVGSKRIRLALPQRGFQIQGQAGVQEVVGEEGQQGESFDGLRMVPIHVIRNDNSACHSGGSARKECPARSEGCDQSGPSGNAGGAQNRGVGSGEKNSPILNTNSI